MTVDNQTLFPPFGRIWHWDQLNKCQNRGDNIIKQRIYFLYICTCTQSYNWYVTIHNVIRPFIWTLLRYRITIYMYMYTSIPVRVAISIFWVHMCLEDKVNTQSQYRRLGGGGVLPYILEFYLLVYIYICFLIILTLLWVSIRGISNNYYSNCLFPYYSCIHLLHSWIFIYNLERCKILVAHFEFLEKNTITEKNPSVRF